MQPALATRRLRSLACSAASGLVVVQGHVYVVADDELCLHCLDSAAPHPGEPPETIHPLFPGVLPTPHAARKRAKPDLEALAFIPPDIHLDTDIDIDTDIGANIGAADPRAGSAGVHRRGGALLALGSGSLDTRMRGALVPLGAGGRIAGATVPVDLRPLCERLLQDLPNLNIEGAAATGDTLVLLQRGNGAQSSDAVILLDLRAARAALARPDPILDGALVREIHRLQLGAFRGVPLTLTDASPLAPGRIVFTCAAEATTSTYDDGPCAGSAVGVLALPATVERLHPIDLPLKLEGIHATPRDDGTIDLILVADADDPTVAAPLLSATLPAP